MLQSENLRDAWRGITTRLFAVRGDLLPYGAEPAELLIHARVHLRCVADYIAPPLDEPLTPALQIAFQLVAHRGLTLHDAIPFRYLFVHCIHSVV